MNKELSEKAVEILTAIQNGMGVVVDKASEAGTFVMGQLPDLAITYIMYGRAKYTILLCLLLILVTLPWVFLVRKWDKLDHKSGEGAFLITILFMGLCVLSIPLYHVLDNTLLLWLAPKIWLIKEIASLIK